ncbi:MAG: ParB/RepB/Spo0J family partition protein [Planctomycetota bacterium]|nr:ParB/RepB/Spo0J family partition protein [Planctomycetota bacterium]
MLLHVAVALILAVAKDIRDRTTPEYRDFFDRLVADIRERGVQVPLIAYREGERVRILDGETRRLAALMAGVEMAPVLLYDEEPDEADLKLAQLLVNTLRRDNTPLERATVYQELMQAKGWTQADLARHVHATPAQIAKDLAISNRCCETVREYVAAGTLKPRAAYAISRLPDPSQQAELAKKAVALPMSVESIEEAVNRLLGTKKAKKPQPMKLAYGSVTATVTGDVVEGLKAFIAKTGEALRRIERDGADPEYLPSLMK